MRVTKKSIIIETTNRVHGMLEQGGICGRVVAYPISTLEETELLFAATAAADDLALGYDVSWRELLAYRCPVPRVIRRGVTIE